MARVKPDFDDLKVCNCADCGELLTGWNQEVLVCRLIDAGHALPRPLAGRVKDRPYCRDCLPSHE